MPVGVIVLSLVIVAAQVAIAIFFSRKLRTRATEPRSRAKRMTHDFSVARWGRACTFNPDSGSAGTVGRMSGTGSGVHSGDFVLVRAGDGHNRFHIDTVEYDDEFWFAKVTLSPRNANEVKRDEGMRLTSTVSWPAPF